MIFMGVKYDRRGRRCFVACAQNHGPGGRGDAVQQKTCIQPWPVATVRSIRAHPSESRGRKASGLPCAAQVAHHDSGVARPESVAPRAAWVLGSPSAGLRKAACCDLLASAGFATDSTVGSCDHERAEPPCHPCAAGLARWARRAVCRPSWPKPLLGCCHFSTRCGGCAHGYAQWFPVPVLNTRRASENIQETTDAENEGVLVMMRFLRRIF